LAGGDVGVIIVGAGSSTRMGGVDKVFAPLAGIPILAHSVETCERLECIGSIVVVVRAEAVDAAKRLAEERGWRKIAAVCAGGERRQDSVRAGLEHLPDLDWLAVHDAARPCVSEDIFERGLVAAGLSGAAVAAVAVKDTIKLVEGERVRETLPRDALWAAQTPQVFRGEVLRRAYAQSDTDATDDATLVEGLGVSVVVFLGSYENIKVTTPEDLEIAELLLRRRQARGR